MSQHISWHIHPPVITIMWKVKSASMNVCKLNIIYEMNTKFLASYDLKDRHELPILFFRSSNLGLGRVEDA